MSLANGDLWLEAFHNGDSAVLATCYREHYKDVARAVSRVVSGSDAETVTHEVFFRLLSQPDMRGGFTGGNLGAWLKRVAYNHAVDFRRKYRNEVSLEGVAPQEADAPDAEFSTDAAALIDRFRKERLPAKWAPVFELRFIEQRPQRDAARVLGIQRTTLVYQELQIRALLRRFLLREAQ